MEKIKQKAEFRMEMQSRRMFRSDDPVHEAFCALFPVENEPEQTRGICKGIQGLIGYTRTRYGMMSITDSFRSVSKLFEWKDTTRPIPEDVVLEILRRLPPEDIVNCRMVCKRWKSLTSTPLFRGLHMTAAHPVILLHLHVPEDDLKLYYLDLAPEEPRIGRFDTSKLQPNDRCCVFGGTCNGMVLLWRREIFGTLLVSICNPLTGRQITASPAKADFYLGFWFNPVKGDYLFLTVSGGGGLPYRGFQYKIFNLEGECTVLGWYADFPTNLPINISGSLYFILQFPMPPQNCIMIFNIESEKIDFKPHPHSYHCHHHHSGHTVNFSSTSEDMCLLEVEGSLGFAHSCSTERSLYLWILVDDATWNWIPRYKIDLNWDRSMGSFCALSGTQKSEMLIHFRSRLFAVNFETRRVRKIDPSMDVPEKSILGACTYVSSLVDPNRVAALT